MADVSHVSKNDKLFAASGKGDIEQSGDTQSVLGLVERADRIVTDPASALFPAHHRIEKDIGFFTSLKSMYRTHLQFPDRFLIEPGPQIVDRAPEGHHHPDISWGDPL